MHLGASMTTQPPVARSRSLSASFRASVLATIFTLALVVTSAAHADPVRVTSGDIFVLPREFGRVGGDLVAGDEGFVFLKFGDDPGQLAIFEPPGRPVFDNGVPVDLSSRVLFTEGFGGWTEFEGFVRFAADLQFSALSATLSHCQGTGFDRTCSGFGRFTFTGLLTGTDDSSGRELFRRRLRGAGTAEGLFEEQFSGNGLIGLNYFFDPAPVPEPATLTLVGIGLAATGWRAKRRRAQTTPPVEEHGNGETHQLHTGTEG